MLRAALAGAFACVLLIYTDVAWYHRVESPAKDLCAFVDEKESLLSSFFGLTVALHSLWLLGCVILASMTVLDINAQMRRVVRGENISGTSLQDKYCLGFVVAFLTGALATVFGLLLCFSDLRNCASLPLTWYFAAFHTPGTLAVVGLAVYLCIPVLSPVSSVVAAAVDNLALWVELRSLGSHDKSIRV